MAQLRLTNNTGRLTTLGRLVKINPKNIKGFIYAELTDTGIIGTVAQVSPSNGGCLINLINTVNWNDIIGKPTTFDTNGTTVDVNSYFPSGW